MHCNLLKAIAATVLISAGSTAAAATDDDLITLRGYGTLGLAYTNEDHADFVSNQFTQTKGVGHSDNLSYKLDTRAALQADFRFSDRFSGVVQVISEAHNNNSWTGDPNHEFVPSLEWANLSYRVTDNLTIRGGRIVLPLFMVSEYRKVGFANHWMRAPVEIYGDVPFNSSDGGDITYKSKIGDAINTARVHWGTQSIRGFANDQVVAYGANDSVESGALTVRAAYMRVDFHSTPQFGFDDVFNAYAGLASPIPGGAAAAEAIRLRNLYSPSQPQHIDNYDIGFIYDPSNWLLMGEVMRVKTAGIVGSSTAGYLSGGYRIRAFTPFATYSQIKSDKRSEQPLPDLQIPTPPLPPPLIPIANGAIPNGIIGSITAVNSSQKTISLGVRWDFATHYDLKAQFDRIETDPGAVGILRTRADATLTSAPLGFTPGSNVNVISIAVDFVF